MVPVPHFHLQFCRMACPMLAEEGWNHAHQWLWQLRMGHYLVKGTWRYSFIDFGGRAQRLLSVMER